MSNIFVAGRTKPAKATCTGVPATGSVAVYHPGYEPPRMLLLLAAFCCPSGNYGVPFCVVLDASRIIANNANGTLRMRGSEPTWPRPTNSPFYRLGTTSTASQEENLCTSFHAWSPPDVLPPHWDVPAMGARAPPGPESNASDCSAGVRTADGRCAVSGDSSRLQGCYLVPAAESEWWFARGMSGRTQNRLGIDSAPNCLAMRGDLTTHGMDLGDFVFAPYAGGAVCVCLTDAMPDFAAEYHLRGVRIPARVHPMNVYARFAWGVFRAMGDILVELGQARDVGGRAEQIAAISSTNLKRGRTNDEDDEDEVSLLTDGGESSDEAPLDVSTPWTEGDLQAAEALDAELSGRPAARYEEAMSMYPGFSKVMRLENEYRREHPEVSAVGSARVARVGEEDDEQRL
ncbi:hypothetical protein K438DRAFT_2041356 [Mycena galopus ATCC 62051]|nr:hypothetical protein K438DRAFT_2041356 [Mycena galopus ATCC 62051]